MANNPSAVNINPATLRAILADGALIHLRARLATSVRQPYLATREDLTQVARQAWRRMCIEHSSGSRRSCLSLAPTSNELYGLRLRVSDAYVELEDLARELVINHYGFKDPAFEASSRHATAAIAFNQNLFRLLTLSHRYLHVTEEDLTYSAVNAEYNLFKHPILQEFVCRAWFDEGEDSPGLRVDERFNPEGSGIPRATVAFVMAAVFHAIHEWESGTRRRVPFLSRIHTFGTYCNFLSLISTWESFTIISNVTQSYGEFRKLVFANASEYAT